MENPHAERQAVLLERIVKNTVSCRYKACNFMPTQSTDQMHWNDSGIEPLYGGLLLSRILTLESAYILEIKEIVRANQTVKIAADLATKYRKNVQYNLEATKGN